MAKDDCGNKPFRANNLKRDIEGKEKVLGIRG